MNGEQLVREIEWFLQTNHIDSFQKLRVLFFFYQHPASSWNGQQIAKQLYLGDGPLLERIITELQAVGLVNCVADRCKSNDKAGIKASVNHLTQTWQNPLARQKILDQVRRSILFNH